ncbi:hypothetical protein LCGC14_1146470 [marine sediment metagenome]|uniref:Cephalosporin hydroxylase n=1 Tax=marine sediment metagenome TaxID=412755 RepID=A0A0F9LWP3_9ZZZZ
MYEDNKELKDAWQLFRKEIVKVKYAYNFKWAGIQILKVPQDIIALQEIIWKVKPNLVIETGVAHGGSAIFFASILELLERCGEIENGEVIGIEIGLYPETRKTIFNHPLSKKITIIDGSSIDEEVIKRVKELAKGKRVLVNLDSNHTHDHVLKELKAYAPLVCIGSYIVVDDTGIDELPDYMFSNRAWGKGNNPGTAVMEFLKENNGFEIDNIDSKLIITGSPSGYLKRIR